MSRTTLQIVRKLAAAAADGNERARAEMRRLRGAVLSRIGDRAVTYSPQPPEDVLGDEDDGDELECADRILRRMQTADTLAHKTALLRGREAAQQQIAPWVRTNPPSVNRGTIGNQIQLDIGEKALKDVIHWPGEDAETTSITVTAAPTDIIVDDPSHPGLFRPFGVLQFGTRGMMVKAFFDVGTGVQFTVTASTATLQFGLDPVGASLPGTIKLAGMLSFAPVVRTTPNTRTVYLDGLNIGDSPTVPIPPFSRTLYVGRQPDQLMTLTVTFETQNGAGLIYQYTITATTSQTEPVPVPNDARFVNISVAGHTGSVRLIFGLAF